jgi:pimeloyl-ACP methyl ester carboxylesterase
MPHPNKSVKSVVQFLKVGKHNLECQLIAPHLDEAPTIVFLHEGLGCVSMWKEFPERLTEATGCGAVVYSRAGYGGSDRAILPRPVSFMHDEAQIVLPNVIDTFELREPILFGHSDGGSIALIHSGSNAAKNIRALILEAPHVFVEDLSIESIKLAKENYESGSLKSGLERYHGDNVECAFRGWNDVWLNPEFRSWNIESYLPAINIPVLVVQGEEDQYGTMAQVEAIERGCSGPVETVMLADCGHSPHRDQPDRVIASVKKFLSNM